MSLYWIPSIHSCLSLRRCLPTVLLPHAHLGVTFGAVKAGKPPTWSAVVSFIVDSCHRSMGQNYVTKDEVLAAIVRAAGVKPGETVLEIGPGTGNLTKHLLLSGAQVIAIEKDDVLIEQLREEFKEARPPLAFLLTYLHSESYFCYWHMCCAVLCCAVLCCAVLCCAVLCCAVLCCAVLGWAGLGWAGLGWAGLGCARFKHYLRFTCGPRKL